MIYKVSKNVIIARILVLCANAIGCCDDVDGDSSSSVVDVGFFPDAVAHPDEVVLTPVSMRSMFPLV